MAKIEELTELLITEINNFEKGITKLEVLSEKINATKISMDLREYKSIIEKHQKKMSDIIQSQERFEKRFGNQLKKAKVYPNWVVIVFIIALLFGVVSTSYAFILKQKINKVEKVAFQKEKVSLIDDL